MMTGRIFFFAEVNLSPKWLNYCSSLHDYQMTVKNIKLSDLVTALLTVL